MTTDEKKPPLGGEVVAQIRVDLLKNGGARMSSVRGEVLDSLYRAMPDGQIPSAVEKLLGELREQLAA